MITENPFDRTVDYSKYSQEVFTDMEMYVTTICQEIWED